MSCRESSGEGEAEAEAEGESEAEAEGEIDIYDIQQGNVEVGTKVVLTDVVVTAVDTYDSGNGVGSIYVQEPEGGEYSGILVYQPSREDFENGQIGDLQPGDLVTVRGTTDEFALMSEESTRRTTELVDATVLYIGAGEPPDPADVDMATLCSTTPDSDTGDYPAEPWEGVLIRATDVAAACVPDDYGVVTMVCDKGEIEVSFDFMADPGVEFEDCYSSVVGPLNYFFSFRIQPRGAGDMESGSSCPNVGVQDIAEVQNGSVDPDTRVRVRGVVTAIDDNPDDQWGLFVQQGTGARSGIFVYAEGNGVTVGDEVVVNGTYEEHFDESQLSFASVCRLGDGSLPTPEELDAASVGQEDWEGVLVSVNGPVTVTDDNPDEMDFGEFVVGGVLRVDDDLYAYETSARALGTSYSAITGVVRYSFDNFKLLPRDASDLVLAK